MDTIDLKILNSLEGNARATAKEIGQKVNLSIPAVSERMRKLEASGAIEEYTLKVNREVMGYHLLAFIFVDIDLEENIDPSRMAIKEFPEVLECHHLAGEYDYLLKVIIKDTKELEHFISKKLKRIKGVQKSNTLISLLTIKEVLNRVEAIE